MHGVTTALVAFLFYCVIFPERVKNKPQYYASLAGVCLIILLDALGMIVGESRGFRVVVYSLGALVQVGTILLLFLSVGGITWRELAGDMKDAYEVIRRGEEDKEIIIPLTGEFARQQANRVSQASDDSVTPPQ